MSDPIVFLPLTQGQVAVIDFADFEKVGRVKWYAMKSVSGNFYAKRDERIRGTKEQKRLYLHCEIMGAKGIDHRDGNGLNCRRENMRVATNQQNNRAFKRKRLGASSVYRGVTWDSVGLKWAAQICEKGVTFHLGRFVNEKEAACAFDTKAVALGFAREALNFP